MKKILKSPDSVPGKTRLTDSVAGSRKTILVSLLAVGTASLGTAAVISPQTGGGAAIDPSGNSDVDAVATGSALLSTFNALGDRVTQVNWSGISGTTGNTINGNDIDVRIDHTVGGFAATNSALQNYNTGAGGDGYQWTGTNGQKLTISFGTASGASFQQFTNDRTVQAAGLVLLNFGSAYTNVAIKYFDSANNVLSTQSFVGGADSQGGTFGGADYFTGYVSSSANIAYLTIDITRTTGSSDIALDALTYAVPEPGSAVLLGLGGFGLLCRRRRSAKLEPTVPA
ncbi:MAG: PEP-CTERM sorting domain-containing protein [Luteolibacter sp.]